MDDGRRAWFWFGGQTRWPVSDLPPEAVMRREIFEFSKAYAEQNERDYQQLAAAVKSGRITAKTGI